MSLNHVEGVGLICLRCVGLAANYATRWCHMVSSSWTGVDRFIWRPLAALSACWRRVNIPAAPAMATTVLRRVPSSLCQCRRENCLALGGLVSIRARRLLLRSSRRVRNFLTVSIAQPRMTFYVLQMSLPLQRFLSEIVSSCAVLPLVLGQKTLSMAQKKCRVI